MCEAEYVSILVKKTEGDTDNTKLVWLPFDGNKWTTDQTVSRME